MPEYVRTPYVEDRRTMLDLMRLASRERSQADTQKAATRAQGLMNIGQLIAGTLASLRQDKEQQTASAAALQKQERDDTFKRRDQELREADLLARMQDRESANAARADAAKVAQDAANYKRGGEVAEEVGYGPMSELQLDSVMQGPAAGRARYVFGPGTADGPELQPTGGQQRGMAAEQAIAGMGGTIGPNGQVIMPPKPEREPNPTEASLAMLAARGDKMAAQALATLRSMRQSDRAPDALVPVVGPDGKTRYGTRTEARGQLVPSSQQKPATGLEKRALNFFNRAQQADTDLEGLEAQIQQMGLGGQTYMQYAPNFMQSELGQQYQQAQRAFTEARLRKDSGAAIPEPEFESDRKTYFAQPGDSKETLEQKRRARGAVLASLGFESGQALGEFVGDAEEATRLVQGYRERSKKPEAGGARGVLVRMRAPNGQVKEVSPDQVEHFKARGAVVVK